MKTTLAKNLRGGDLIKPRRLLKDDALSNLFSEEEELVLTDRMMSTGYVSLVFGKSFYSVTPNREFYCKRSKAAIQRNRGNNKVRNESLEQFISDFTLYLNDYGIQVKNGVINLFKNNRNFRFELDYILRGTSLPIFWIKLSTGNMNTRFQITLDLRSLEHEKIDKIAEMISLIIKSEV